MEEGIRVTLSNITDLREISDHLPVPLFMWIAGDHILTLFHPIHWKRLQVILENELIEPQVIGADDCRNKELEVLSIPGVRCAWFSTINWNLNRFGNYILSFESKDLVLPRIVPLGNHNGARHYFSAPPLPANRIGSRFSIGVISSASDTSWRPRIPHDRVDIL